MLPDLWMQCDNCHSLALVNAYTGLCVGCGSDEQGFLLMERREHEFRLDSVATDGNVCEVRSSGDRVGEGTGHHSKASEAADCSPREDEDHYAQAAKD